MASLDDLLLALNERYNVVKKQNEIQKAFSLLDAYLNKSAPEGTAAYEYGKLLYDTAKINKIDLNEALQSSGGLTGSYRPGIGQSANQIALINALFSGETALPESVSYKLPTNILESVVKQNLIDRALLDIDPIANAIVNPSNSGNLRESLKQTFLKPEK